MPAALPPPGGKEDSRRDKHEDKNIPYHFDFGLQTGLSLQPVKLLNGPLIAIFPSSTSCRQ
jgi:hypothetical protein